MDLLCRSEDVAWVEEPIREMYRRREGPKSVDRPAAPTLSLVACIVEPKKLRENAYEPNPGTAANIQNPCTVTSPLLRTY